MFEIAPGIYTHPRMKKAVRERLWDVMCDWVGAIPEDGGIVLFWADRNAPAGLNMRFIGFPKKELVEYEGTWLTHSPLTQRHEHEELAELADIDRDLPF